MEKLKIILDSIQNCLAKVSNDKLLHFIAGLLIYHVFNLIFPHYKVVSFTLVCLIGVAKEWWIDKCVRKVSPEWQDAFATAIGAIVGFILH